MLHGLAWNWNEPIARLALIGGFLDESQIKTKHLLEAASRCRQLVLDDFELELGDNPRWPKIRQRLLNIFGTRGLEGKIVAIMAVNL